MGKDLNGKELGKGFSQRRDGRYNARAVIKGVKIDICNMSLSQLKKDFNSEKTKVLSNNSATHCKTTLNEWYREWFSKCKSPQLKSDISRNTYDRKIRNTFLAILGDKVLSDISQINIQTATNELIDKGYKDRTIREALGVLRECLDIAIVNKLTTANPCQGIIVRDGNECQKERRVLKNWEQELLLEEIKGCYYDEAYRFLLLTGVRIGEFSGLQWNDIDWENKVIKIRRTMSTGYFNGKKVEELTTPKTANAYRDIPFFGETETVLKSWQKKQNEYKKKLGTRWRANPEHGDLIFTSTMGSPVTRYVLVHDLKRVEENLILKEQSKAYLEGREPREIEHLHPHCFRHTFCTRCFEKNMNPVVIQYIMGHSSYSTTISYTHVLEDKKKEEVSRVGNFFDLKENIS